VCPLGFSGARPSVPWTATERDERLETQSAVVMRWAADSTNDQHHAAFLPALPNKLLYNAVGYCPELGSPAPKRSSP
jgi:hypothetical protein